MAGQTDVLEDRSITIERTMRAPRDRVYQAFLEPQALARASAQTPCIAGPWR